MTGTDIAYRKTAVEGASGFGLLIALYDTLAGDLRRAAAAQRSGNLEARTRELKHALLIVSYLQNLVDAESGELARKLIAFYSRLRRQILAAQAKRSAEMLEEEMAAVLDMRSVWQKFEFSGIEYGPEILPPSRPQSYGGFVALQMESRHMSWTA